MIFVSHNYKDKDVVEPIAVRMREIYGEENVFYDAWSIKPGESIIGKMNEGIGKCKYFFFFISQNSLNSSMVDLEWQTALYKATKEGIKFIPIKVDDCYPPQILLSTLYIDMYSYGLENTLKDMFDIIENKNSKEYKSVFKNLVCYLKPINEKKIKLTIKALKLIEPNSSFAISFSNKLEDIQFHVDSDGMSNIYSGEIDNCNSRGARVSRVLTPQFPFEATIKNNSLEKLKDVAVWHQIGKNNFERLEIIIG